MSTEEFAKVVLAEADFRAPIVYALCKNELETLMVQDAIWRIAAKMGFEIDRPYADCITADSTWIFVMPFYRHQNSRLEFPVFVYGEPDVVSSSRDPLGEKIGRELLGLPSI